MKLWTANNWKPIFAPLPITNEVSPVAICPSSLNMNMMSISEKCVVIEECETNMDEFLSDLGFDVIGVPLRSLNEFGGGVHCVTWDILQTLLFFSPLYMLFFFFFFDRI